MKKQHVVIIAAVGLLGAFVAAGYAYKSHKAKQLTETAGKNPSVLERPHAPTVGPKDAKVHIVEFLDPGCEACRAFHPYVKQIMAKHEGKVRLSVRYLPLHKGADTMVKILEAARKQNKWTETLEMMFATQPQWASHHNPQPEKIWPFLPQIGLDVDRVRADMESPEILKVLETDMADAKTLMIRKTPSFFVNGQPLIEFGLPQLTALVDNAVAANY